MKNLITLMAISLFSVHLMAQDAGIPASQGPDDPKNAMVERCQIRYVYSLGNLFSTIREMG